MTEFAKVLDYVEIMNYDLDLGTGPNVTANAPLFDQCAPESLQYGSAASAINAWTTAGMPANQIVLGVAAYGHSFTVPKADAFNGTSLALYPAFNASNTPKGDSQDVGTPTGTADVCGNPQPAGFDGIFNFWGLFQQGYLRNTSSSLVEVNSGISYMFDNCSQTVSSFSSPK
jgi:chitinase